VDDGFDRGLDEGIIDGDLELELRQQARLILGAAIELGVPLLPAAAADVGDRHQVNVALVERRLHRLELFGADDGHHHFHGRYPLLARSG
jgi:hypothetical protein